MDEQPKMHQEDDHTSSSSIESSSDITTEDDASSSNDSLYNLSDLMSQLPFKRSGLSKFYNGRSQSFACLSSAKSIEDLEKKESSYASIIRKNRIKKCKSFHCGLKPVISKKTTNQFRRKSLLSVQEHVS